jgi:hypothetical protein
MPRSDSFLDISVINPELHRRYFQYPSSTGQILEFNDIAEWRNYLESCRIRSHRVPAVSADQFHVALRIMLFAWADGSVIKAAEMTALASLENSLKAVYHQKFHSAEPKKRQSFADYLNYMVKHDDLPATYHSDKNKESGNALNLIRNSIAHGNLFNELPWGGLMEAIRDIIEHAFRNYPECSQQLVQFQTAVPLDVQNGIDVFDEDDSETSVW